jgi:hypothetical protein
VIDKTCLFCEGTETCNHLFFECVVAKLMWDMISQVVGISMVESFENIGSHWLCNKKFVVFNMISSVALRALWKTRNDMCFQNVQWRNIGMILGRIAGHLQNWLIL